MLSIWACMRYGETIFASGLSAPKSTVSRPGSRSQPWETMPLHCTALT